MGSNSGAVRNMKVYAYLVQNMHTSQLKVNFSKGRSNLLVWRTHFQTLTWWSQKIHHFSCWWWTSKEFYQRRCLQSPSRFQCLWYFQYEFHRWKCDVLDIGHFEAFQVMICSRSLWLWQYGLWSFHAGDIKLKRFNIPKGYYQILSFGLMASCQK